MSRNRLGIQSKPLDLYLGMNTAARDISGYNSLGKFVVMAIVQGTSLVFDHTPRAFGASELCSCIGCRGLYDHEFFLFEIGPYKKNLF